MAINPEAISLAYHVINGHFNPPASNIENCPNNCYSHLLQQGLRCEDPDIVGVEDLGMWEI